MGTEPQAKARDFVESLLTSTCLRGEQCPEVGEGPAGEGDHGEDPRRPV